MRWTETSNAHPSASDADVAGLESDAGLLEVDILELLFDCVPDGQTPDAGLGSACSTDAECGDASLVCDVDNGGGTCAPDAAITNVGEPCTTTVDCGTYSRDACASEVGDDFPVWSVARCSSSASPCSPTSTTIPRSS